MTEEDAKFALLQTELNGIQASIRSFDAIDFQIKGWCVTTALAIGGFAVAYKKPVLLVVGMAAVAGFYLVNCQFKGIQRAFIRRNSLIDLELKKTGIMHFLNDSNSLDIVGTSIPGWKSSSGPSWRSRARNQIEEILYEARLPNTFSLYLFIFVCLLAEALTLF